MSRRNHRWQTTCPAPAGLVRPVRVDPTGRHGPTRGQARGRHWRQTSWGYYVPATVSDEAPEQRIMEQSVRLPPGGAVTGWASGRLFGANFMDGLLPDGVTRIPVPLALGEHGNVRPDGAVTLSRDRLPADEIVVRYGIPCTRRERGVFDAARTAADRREATVLLEMAFAAEVTSQRRTQRYVDAHPGWLGAPQARDALSLTSELSRSPNETRTRLVWVLDAGLPPPLVNQPVFDLRGTLLGIADLLDLAAGVVGEFDGADHRGAARHSADVGREDRFRRHGLEVFRVTGPDLRFTERVVRRMHGARDRARWEAPARRRWTIVPPPWWETGPALDEVLDQRDWLAQVHAESGESW